MKSWKIILWLLLFFPVGLYLMFKHSNWSKKVKYGVSGFFSLLILASSLEGRTSFISIISFAIIVMSILLFDKNKNRKQSLSIMLIGVILFGFSYQETVSQEAEQARIEQQEQEADQAQIEQRKQEAKERRAERARKQKITEKEEEEKKLKEQIVAAIEKVNEEPTEANYLKAMALLGQLNDNNNQLVKELEDLKPTVDEYEENLKVARDAVEQAEADLNRQSHNNASELVSALSTPNSQLVHRLDDLDNELTKVEEEEKQLAKEKLEAEKAAQEEKQLAEEKQDAEKAAQEEKQLAEEKQDAEKAQQEAKTAQTAEPAATNTEKVVYIAPQSGTKYHFSADCRGLSNANSVEKVDLSVAKSQGYDLCGWEK